MTCANTMFVIPGYLRGIGNCGNDYYPNSGGNVTNITNNFFGGDSNRNGGNITNITNNFFGDASIFNNAGSSGGLLGNPVGMIGNLLGGGGIFGGLLGGSGSSAGLGQATAFSNSGYANANPFGSSSYSADGGKSLSINGGSLFNFSKSGDNKAFSVLGGMIGMAKSSNSSSYDFSGAINTLLPSLIG